MLYSAKSVQCGRMNMHYLHWLSRRRRLQDSGDMGIYRLLYAPGMILPVKKVATRLLSEVIWMFIRQMLFDVHTPIHPWKRYLIVYTKTRCTAYVGKQLTCLSPCQYYEYSLHCIHAIWICVKYCKSLTYSLDLFVLMF